MGFRLFPIFTNDQQMADFLNCLEKLGYTPFMKNGRPFIKDSIFALLTDCSSSNNEFSDRLGYISLEELTELRNNANEFYQISKKDLDEFVKIALYFVDTCIHFGLGAEMN